ncbi:MAG: hypothetical protein HOH66_09660 [Rhodospirillaceae bacterium]|nr:hypothetical protein [Rhodospirillaceae bacterium]
MKFCAFLLAAAISIAVVPTRAAAPIEEPDYNHPEDALMAIQDLQTVVGVLARERGLQGYADQCDLAVRDAETHAMIYGVPERADLRRGWTICYRAYRAVAPEEAGAADLDSRHSVRPAPTDQAEPSPGQPLDAPPDFLAKPAAGE